MTTYVDGGFTGGVFLDFALSLLLHKQQTPNLMNIKVWLSKQRVQTFNQTNSKLHANDTRGDTNYIMGDTNIKPMVHDH